MVDTTRLADCFPAIDYFEEQHIPFVDRHQLLPRQVTHDVNDVRQALSVKEEMPMILVDARNRDTLQRCAHLAGAARHGAGRGLGQIPRSRPLGAALASEGGA